MPLPYGCKIFLENAFICSGFFYNELQLQIDPGDDPISDSLFEEHMEAPHGQAGPNLSQALSLLQTCAVYRPVQISKGSKLPVLIKQGPGYRDIRLSFPDSIDENLHSTPGAESDHHMTTPDLPVIRLNAAVDPYSGLNGMEQSLEDLYIEYPRPPPHQVSTGRWRRFC